MKTKEEIRNWLLENAVDEYGNLMLSGLDFSDFDDDVYIDNMKVKGNLYQYRQEVQGNLYQDSQEVQGSLYQGEQDVQGHLYQGEQDVQGNLYQTHHAVRGDLTHGGSKYGGKLTEYPYSKMLKKITLAELEELGYELEVEGY